jgi:hypothetical protein
MRYTVFRRWILVVLAAMVAVLPIWPLAGEAQTLGTITGTITGTLTGTTTVLGDTGTLIAGTNDALDTSADSVSISSLLTAEVPGATVIGYTDEIDSDATLAGLNITIAGMIFSADSVVARAMTPLGAAGVGASYIDNLSINGVSVSITGGANQTVAIPGGQLVINEQYVLSDGTLVVNALHVTVSGLADVVVAHAMAGASGGDATEVRATTF